MPALIIFTCYLLGSIPFGFLVAKIWNIDIRRCGSGNIGATNVLRTLGFLPGVSALLLDLLKGTLAVIIAAKLLNNPVFIVICGLAAILGHTFPIFLKFKGGKGAATAVGVLLGVAPDIFFFAVVIFLVIVALTRYVSVGSVLTSLAVTAVFFASSRPLPYSIAAVIATILIIIRHIPNIKRLVQGTEPRIREKA